MTIPPQIGDLEWIHEQIGNSPAAWLTWVDTLLEAARRIRPREPGGPAAQLPDGTQLMLATDAVYAMLLGYAFECALKGLWVQAGNKIIVGGRYQKVAGVRDHDLLPLAKKVGVVASDEELDALNRLSPFVRFAGRYPVPLRSDEMKARKVAGKGDVVPGFYGFDDCQTAGRLLNRLVTKLRFPERL